MTAEDAMTRENEDDLYAALGVGRDATKTEVGFVFLILFLAQRAS
jgi:hypothetical protein